MYKACVGQYRSYRVELLLPELSSSVSKKRAYISDIGLMVNVATNCAHSIK